MKETWNSLFPKDKFHLINNWCKDNDYIWNAHIVIKKWQAVWSRVAVRFSSQWKHISSSLFLMQQIIKIKDEMLTIIGLSLQRYTKFGFCNIFSHLFVIFLCRNCNKMLFWPLMATITMPCKCNWGFWSDSFRKLKWLFDLINPEIGFH